MARLYPPQLRSGGLSGRVFCITYGKLEGDLLVASRKYDVTGQFEALARERGWTPPEPVTNGGVAPELQQAADEGMGT